MVKQHETDLLLNLNSEFTLDQDNSFYPSTNQINNNVIKENNKENEKNSKNYLDTGKIINKKVQPI